MPTHSPSLILSSRLWLSVNPSRVAIQVSTMLSDVFSASACDLLPTRNSFDGSGL